MGEFAHTVGARRRTGFNGFVGEVSFHVASKRVGGFVAARTNPRRDKARLPALATCLAAVRRSAGATSRFVDPITTPAALASTPATWAQRGWPRSWIAATPRRE